MLLFNFFNSQAKRASDVSASATAPTMAAATFDDVASVAAVAGSDAEDVVDDDVYDDDDADDEPAPELPVGTSPITPSVGNPSPCMEIDQNLLAKLAIHATSCNICWRLMQRHPTSICRPSPCVQTPKIGSVSD
jgi:hypothetical protein